MEFYSNMLYDDEIPYSKINVYILDPDVGKCGVFLEPQFSCFKQNEL